MTAQIVFQPSPETNNRQNSLLPLNLSPLVTSSPARDKKPTVGECAGSTAAECAAICCCCPFVLMEFLALALYKVPISIFRRIWRRRLLRNRLKKRRMLNNNAICDSDRRSTVHCSNGEELLEVDQRDMETFRFSIDGGEEVVDDLDKEMWEWFHSTGFGRSISQRHSC